MTLCIRTMPTGRPLVTFYRVVRDSLHGGEVVRGDPLGGFLLDHTTARHELEFWRSIYQDAYLCEYETRVGSSSFELMFEASSVPHHA